MSSQRINAQKPTQWRSLLFAVPILLVAGLMVVFYRGLGRDTRDLPSPLIGKPAPRFHLPRLEDPSRTASNEDFRGRAYVLNVWATWCAPCREEHPVLMQIAGRNEVPIVGVNYKDDATAARSWLQRYGNPYATTVSDSAGDAAIDWGVYGAPTTFLVDADGRVIYKRIYPITMEIWNAEFLPRLAAARTPRSEH